MTILDHDPDIITDYFDRVNLRLIASNSVMERTHELEQIATTGRGHLDRFILASKRYERAVKFGDKVSKAYETEVMSACLYETWDTTYIVLHLLGLSTLNLDTSADGYGLTGDSASCVVQILGLLNQQCEKAFELESQYSLNLLFDKSVDEREGITFVHKPHWCDFAFNSVEESFKKYFARAKRSTREALIRKPLFWKHQNFRQYLERHNYTGITRAAVRLLDSSLPEE